MCMRQRGWGIFRLPLPRRVIFSFILTHRHSIFQSVKSTSSSEDLINNPRIISPYTLFSEKLSFHLESVHLQHISDFSDSKELETVESKTHNSLALVLLEVARAEYA